MGILRDTLVLPRVESHTISTNGKRQRDLNRRLEQVHRGEALVTLKDRECLIADGDLAGANQSAVTLRAGE